MESHERENEAGCVERLHRLADEQGFWTHEVIAHSSGARRAAPVCIESLGERPGIAIILGECRGFDLELSLAATLVVASPGARFEGGRANPPRFPGTLHRLRMRLGAGSALAFWLSPRSWSARRAQARGLVDALSENPVELAQETWGPLWSTQGAATEKIRLLGRSRSGLSEGAAIALERALFALSFADEKARKGARGFFE